MNTYLTVRILSFRIWAHCPTGITAKHFILIFHVCQKFYSSPQKHKYIIKSENNSQIIWFSFFLLLKDILYAWSVQTNYFLSNKKKKKSKTSNTKSWITGLSPVIFKHGWLKKVRLVVKGIVELHILLSYLEVYVIWIIVLFLFRSLKLSMYLAPDAA